MYLGYNRILKRIREAKLLEDTETGNVQGAGVDIRIDKVYKLKSPSHLGVEKRKLPELEELDGDIYTLRPGKYYLLLTMEKVNMPKELVGYILNRSTLFRSGVSLRTAVIDPGYKGQLTVGIKNEGNYNFTLERGARIGQIVFSKIEGDSVGYNGKYQGGKVR